MTFNSAESPQKIVRKVLIGVSCASSGRRSLRGPQTVIFLGGATAAHGALFAQATGMRRLCCLGQEKPGQPHNLQYIHTIYNLLCNLICYTFKIYNIKQSHFYSILMNLFWKYTATMCMILIVQCSKGCHYTLSGIKKEEEVIDEEMLELRSA